MIPITDDIRIRNTSWATWTLIGLNTLLFFWTLAVPEWRLERLFAFFGAVPARLTHPIWASYQGFPDGGWLTLFTSLFLHGGFLHWLANMWSLGLFGPRVEDRIGSGRFLGLYLLAGLGASLTHVWFFPDSTVPIIGASGAVAGVMGAYLLLYPTAWITLAVPLFIIFWFVRIPALLFLPLWYLGELFSGVLSLAEPGYSNIAFMAHVGGFLAGMSLIPWFAGASVGNHPGHDSAREGAASPEQEPPPGFTPFEGFGFRPAASRVRAGRVVIPDEIIDETRGLRYRVRPFGS